MHNLSSAESAQRGVKVRGRGAEFSGHQVIIRLRPSEEQHEVRSNVVCLLTMSLRYELCINYLTTKV